MLVIFDIDGTLTQTRAIDASVFAQSFAETFGAPLPSLDWTTYRNVTDSGVAEDGALRALGRRAKPEEILAMRDRFVSLLAYALRAHDGPLGVPGAAVILDHLREERRSVALATGCWEASARMKLAHAGIDITSVPLATSDHAPERERIITNAIEAAGAVVGRDPIVYVGDGPWDVAAARRVGIAFVGIDHEGTGHLGRTGAFDVLRDFDDGSAFFAALVRAHRRMESRSTQ